MSHGEGVVCFSLVGPPGVEAVPKTLCNNGYGAGNDTREKSEPAWIFWQKTRSLFWPYASRGRNLVTRWEECGDGPVASSRQNDTPQMS